MTAAGPVTLGESFALMVCEEQDLLDAEFEAIMTANGFDPEPPVPSAPERTRAGRCNGPGLVPHGHVQRLRASGPAGPVPGRQRSPP